MRVTPGLLAAVAKGGGEPFAEAAIIGHLQRLDIAVADDRDAHDARPPCHGIITDPGIPALRIDPVGRRDLVAHPPDAALIRRIANDAVDEVVGRHIARDPDEMEHDELAKREEHHDADQHQANICGEWLRRTATARFFLYRWQVRPEFLVDLLLPRARAATEYIANTDIGAVLADRRGVEVVTDYLFDRLDAVVHAIGARLLLAMDGDRFAIYRGADSPALVLNQIAAETAARHNIPFVDLHPAFAADWQNEHRRFDFDADGHWNEHGHEIAAAAIGRALRTLSRQFEPD